MSEQKSIGTLKDSEKSTEEVIELTLKETVKKEEDKVDTTD